MNRVFFTVLLGISSLSVSADASAQDRAVAVRVTEVSGVAANCEIPDGFSLKYTRNKRLKRLNLAGKSARITRNRSAITHKEVDGKSHTGRRIRTSFNLRSKSVEVTEVAVALDGESSCKFVFRGDLRASRRS